MYLTVNFQEFDIDNSSISNHNVNMISNTISLISRIRENANRIIIKKLEENGINNVVPSHGDIIAALFRKEKYTMKELANEIHRTKSTLTVLVDKLIALNLIEKDKSKADNRITYIKLTEKGLKFKPIFKKISEEMGELIYKDMAETEIKTLEVSLSKINNNLR